MCTPRLRPRWAMATSAREEVRELVGERGELVDDHDEPGDRLTTGTCSILREIAGTNRAQQPLPTVEFGVEADERTLGEAVVEVGHQSDRVRKIDARVERRATLVVDQHEVQVHSDPTRLARLTTSVRSSSLLPEPVVPATNACGPSATRSISTIPSADDADRGPQRRIGAGRAPAGDDGRRHPRQWRRCRAPRASARRGGLASDVSPSSGSTSGASARAARQAVASSSPATHTRSNSRRRDRSPTHTAPPLGDTPNVRRHTVGTVDDGVDRHDRRRTGRRHEPTQRSRSAR